MDLAEIVLFGLESMDYTRSWIRDLLISISALAFVALICSLLSYSILLIPSLRLRCVGLILVGLLGAANALIWIWGVSWISVRRQSFRCRVTSDIVECICPVPWRGSSFRISVHEIATILRSSINGEGEKCTISTNDGALYDLTYWYGNPVHQVIDAIADRNPSVRIVEFGVPREPIGAPI